MPHFYTPWKRQKTKGFLTFSGDIEMWHWTKMGYDVWQSSEYTSISNKIYKNKNTLVKQCLISFLIFLISLIWDLHLEVKHRLSVLSSTCFKHKKDVKTKRLINDSFRLDFLANIFSIHFTQRRTVNTRHGVRRKRRRKRRKTYSKVGKQDLKNERCTKLYT